MPTREFGRFDDWEMLGKQLVDATMKSWSVCSPDQEHRPPKAS
jgi:hypothetical protein